MSDAKSPGEKKPSVPAGSAPVAVSGTVVTPAAVASPVVDGKEPIMAAGSPQLSAAAASPPSTTASPAVGEPSVESFTFGSVVAPVVSSTDRAALHFGTPNVWGKPAPSASVPAPSVAAVSADKTADAPSSSSSAVGHSSPPAVVVTSPAANAKCTEGTRVHGDPLQSTVSKPAAAEAGKAVAWGAKKSFADVSAARNLLLYVRY
jgi:hypothetical protein